MRLTYGSLFSGIGGFDLGLDRAGMECRWQVEIDPYCQRVLAKHWPDVKRYADIRTVHGIATHPQVQQDWGIQQPELQTDTGTGCDGILAHAEFTRTSGQKEDLPFPENGRTENFVHRLRSAAEINASRISLGRVDSNKHCPSCLAPVDLICGGVPCQPASCAGKQRGTADDRWLWPEALRIVREVGPKWFIFENVCGLLALESGMVFDSLLLEMEALGYEVETFVIPACSVDAPHRRDRVWIVGYSSQSGLSKRIMHPGIRGQEKFRIEGKASLLGGQDVGYADGGRWQGFSRSWEERIAQSGQDVADTECEPATGRNNRTEWRKRSESCSTSNGGSRNWIANDRWLPESRLGFSNDGLSPKMDGGGLDETKSKDRPREILQSLQAIIVEEEISGNTGKHELLSSQEILQSELYGSRICQRCAIKVGSFKESKDIPWEQLRIVWGYAHGCSSSHRRESFEQLSREYSDFMRQLSCYTPPPCSSCWADGSWEDGITRVASGVKDRVARLKALGNAVVPQLVEVLGRAIIEADRRQQ